MENQPHSMPGLNCPRCDLEIHPTIEELMNMAPANCPGCGTVFDLGHHVTLY